MDSAGSRSPVAAVVGATILADAALARVLLAAGPERVYFLGKPILAACAFRRATGLPCPTCGLSRSTVLALHGDLGAAWHIMPAGPVLVLGALAMAVALLGYAAVAPGWRPASRAAARRWIGRGGLAYGAAAVVLWLGGWAAQFLNAWHGGLGK
ncbi:MAG: DUF2752 domain-containing protein [Bryobacteraceae bacterium]|jgi:hypothetical protein